jgi:hypothetical protein
MPTSGLTEDQEIPSKVALPSWVKKNDEDDESAIGQDSENSPDEKTGSVVVPKPVSAPATESISREDDKDSEDDAESEANHNYNVNEENTESVVKSTTGSEPSSSTPPWKEKLKTRSSREDPGDEDSESGSRSEADDSLSSVKPKETTALATVSRPALVESAVIKAKDENRGGVSSKMMEKHSDSGLEAETDAAPSTPFLPWKAKFMPLPTTPVSEDDKEGLRKIPPPWLSKAHSEANLTSPTPATPAWKKRLGLSVSTHGSRVKEIETSNPVPPPWLTIRSRSGNPSSSIQAWKAKNGLSSSGSKEIPQWIQKKDDPKAVPWYSWETSGRGAAGKLAAMDGVGQKEIGAKSEKKKPETKAEHDEDSDSGDENPRRVSLALQALSLPGIDNDSDSDDDRDSEIIRRSLRPTTSAEESAKSKVITGPDDDGSEVSNSEKPTVAVLPREANAKPNKVGIPEFMKKAGLQQLHAKSPVPLAKQTKYDQGVGAGSRKKKPKTKAEQDEDSDSGDENPKRVPLRLQALSLPGSDSDSDSDVNCGPKITRRSLRPSTSVEESGKSKVTTGPDDGGSEVSDSEKPAVAVLSREANAKPNKVGIPEFMKKAGLQQLHAKSPVPLAKQTKDDKGRGAGSEKKKPKTKAKHEEDSDSGDVNQNPVPLILQALSLPGADSDSDSDDNRSGHKITRRSLRPTTSAEESTKSKVTTGPHNDGSEVPDSEKPTVAVLPWEANAKPNKNTFLEFTQKVGLQKLHAKSPAPLAKQTEDDEGLEIGSEKKNPETKAERDEDSDCGHENPKHVPLRLQALSLPVSDSDSDTDVNCGPKITRRSLRPSTSAEESAKSTATTGPDDDGSEVYDSEIPTVAVLPREANAKPNKVGIPEFMKKAGLQQLHAKSPVPLAKQTKDDKGRGAGSGKKKPKTKAEQDEYSDSGDVNPKPVSLGLQALSLPGSDNDSDSDVNCGPKITPRSLRPSTSAEESAKSEVTTGPDDGGSEGYDSEKPAVAVLSLEANERFRKTPPPGLSKAHSEANLTSPTPVSQAWKKRLGLSVSTHGSRVKETEPSNPVPPPWLTMRPGSENPSISIQAWKAKNGLSSSGSKEIPQWVQKKDDPKAVPWYSWETSGKGAAGKLAGMDGVGQKEIGAKSEKKNSETKAEHDEDSDSGDENPKRVPLTLQALSLAGSDNDSDSEDDRGPEIIRRSLRPSTSVEESAKSKVTTGPDDGGSEVSDSKKPAVAVLSREANAKPNKVGIPEFMKKAGLQQLHAKLPVPLAKQTEDDTTISTIPETISTYTRVRKARQEEKSNQQGQQSMALPASVDEESYMDEADTWKSDSEDSASLKEGKPISSSGDDIAEAEQASKSPQADDSASESSSSSSSAAVKGTSDLPWGLKSNSDGNTEPIPELPPSPGISREIKNTTDGDQAGLIMNRRGRDDIKKQYSQGDESMLFAEMNSSWILPLRTDLNSSWVNPAKAVDLDPTRPIFAELTKDSTAVAPRPPPPNAPPEITLKSEANRDGVNPSERATDYTTLAAVAYHIGSTCTDPKPRTAGTKAPTATSIAANASPSISKSTNDHGRVSGPGVGKEEGLENSIASFATSNVYDVPPFAKEDQEKTRTANLSDSSKERGNISPSAVRVAAAAAAAAAVDNNTVTTQTSKQDEQEVGLSRSTHRSKVVPPPWLEKAQLEANSAPTPEWKKKLLLSASAHNAQATKEKESTEATSSGLTATPKTEAATGGSSDSPITISATASVPVADAKGQISAVSSSTHRSKVAAPWLQTTQSEANLAHVPEAASPSVPVSGFIRQVGSKPSSKEAAAAKGDTNSPLVPTGDDGTPRLPATGEISRGAFIPVSGITLGTDSVPASNDENASSIGDNPFSKRPEVIPRNAFDKDASSIDDNPFSKRPERIPRNAFDKVPESADDSSSIAARTTTSSTQAVISSNATKSSTDFESWVPRNDPDLERKNENPSPALQKYEADRSAWESGSILSGDQESVPTTQVSRAIDSTSTDTHNRGFDPNIPKDENEIDVTLRQYEDDKAAWESDSIPSRPKVSPIATTSRALQDSSETRGLLEPQESWIPRDNEAPAVAQAANESLSTAARSANENQSLSAREQQPPGQISAVPARSKRSVRQLPSSSDSIPSRPKASPIATTSRARQDSSEIRGLLEPEESWIPRDNEASAVAQAANESLSTAARSANENQSLPARQQQPPGQIFAIPARSKRSVRQLPSSSWVPAATKTKSAQARSARVDFTGAISMDDSQEFTWAPEPEKSTAAAGRRGKTKSAHARAVNMDDSQEFKWVPKPEKSTAGDGEKSPYSVEAAPTTSSVNSESEEARSVSSEVKRTREIMETIASAAPYYYDPDDATPEAPGDTNSDNSLVLETPSEDDVAEDGSQVFQQETDAGKEENLAAVMRSLAGGSVNSATLENANFKSANQESANSTMSFVMDLDEMEAQRVAPYDARSRTSSRVSFGGEETIIFDDSEDHFYEEPRAKNTCRLSRLRLLSLCILLLVIPIAAALITVLLVKDDRDNNSADRSTTVTGTSSPIASPDPAPRPIPTPPTTLSPTTAPAGSPAIPVTEAPVLSPAPQPPTQPPISSVDALLQLLSGVSADGGAALRDPSSPQYRAMQWIRTPNNAGIYDDRRFIQRYALAVLYYSTRGESWSLSRSWLTGANECDWYLAETGTPTCDDDGDIVTIALAENNLDGPLPRELALLGRSLSEYQVRVNDVNKTDHLIWHLTSFLFVIDTETIQLSGNKLTGFIPFQYSNMTQLSKYGPPSCFTSRVP